MILDATIAADHATFRDPDGNSNYDPPLTGVHLCGQTDDGEQPTTAAIYPMGEEQARRFFNIARAQAECPPGEDDFVVDLCVAGDIVADFLTNRQLWPRAISLHNEQLAT